MFVWNGIETERKKSIMSYIAQRVKPAENLRAYHNAHGFTLIPPNIVSTLIIVQLKLTVRLMKIDQSTLSLIRIMLLLQTRWGRFYVKIRTEGLFEYIRTSYFTLYWISRKDTERISKVSLSITRSCHDSRYYVLLWPTRAYIMNVEYSTTDGAIAP